VSHRSSVKTVFRLDRGTLRKPERTPQGFLRVDGIASRTGVFEYTNPDGSIRRELRLDEEVFAPKALAGFEGAPLTDGHPPVMVTADNVRSYEVGTVTSPARRDGGFVVTSIVIKDPKVIRKVERGDTGLSVGYSVDLDETPGVHPKFGRYDAVQRNLVINHLAVAVTPRAGEAARIRMDAADIAIEIDRSKSDRETGVKMSDQETDKQRTDRLDGMVKALEKELAEARALIAANAMAAESEAVKLEKQRADEAEAKVARFDATFRDAVRTRSKLEREASAVMGNGFRMDDLSDHQIREAVVKRLDATADVDGANEDIVRGQYQVLISRSVANAAAQARVGEILAQRTDAKRADEEGEREKRIADYRNQWRKTLAGNAAAKGA
jgi:uncharacterized protein